jgi:hypothetical protein
LFPDGFYKAGKFVDIKNSGKIVGGIVTIQTPISFSTPKTTFQVQ